MIKLQKNTADDKRNILSSALDQYENHGIHVWLTDYDDTYVYFRQTIYTDNVTDRKTFRATYSFSGTSATIDNEVEEVVALTDYQLVSNDKGTGDKKEDDVNGTVVVPKEAPSVQPMVASADVALNSTQAGLASSLEFVQKGLADRVLDLVKTAVGSEKSLPVMKQFKEEEMIAYEPLYIAAGEVDGVGDTYSREDVNAMVKSFNEANEAGDIQPALFHKHATDTFTINKAFVNEFDVTTVGGELIPEGQPIAEIQFVSKAAWEARKDGDLMGLSIGCTADFKDIND